MSGVFTGIIQHVGRVAGVAAAGAGKRIRIEAGPLGERLAPGASLAVDGACLTAVAVTGGVGEFDVVPETLQRTTLGRLKRGDRVNLEPPISAGAPLDGHIVQGHVDGLAEVKRIEAGSGGHVVHLAAPAELTAQMALKGSVALAGVSLTLAGVAEGRFSVALIPATLAGTTLGELKISDPVNVELDIIGKYVRRHLETLAAGGLTIQKLREEGFA
jgi:riboflavin synthase